MNIITTPIINAHNDAVWNPLPASICNMSQKPVLVITNVMDQESDEYNILMKMLAGSNLLPDHYNHVQIADEELISWSQLHHKLNPFIVFIIGVLPSKLGVAALFKLNEPNNYDGTIWLPTIRARDVVQDINFKKHLWEYGMKPLFVDKVYGALVCPSTAANW